MNCYFSFSRLFSASVIPVYNRNNKRNSLEELQHVFLHFLEPHRDPPKYLKPYFFRYNHHQSRQFSTVALCQSRKQVAGSFPKAVVARACYISKVITRENRAKMSEFCNAVAIPFLTPLSLVSSAVLLTGPMRLLISNLFILPPFQCGESLSTFRTFFIFILNSLSMTLFSIFIWFFLYVYSA